MRLPFKSEYEAVLSQIHIEMACQDFALKPMLAYKMSSTGKNAIELANVHDWENLVMRARRTLKRKDPVVAIQIIPDEKVVHLLYIFTLTNHDHSI